jgi:hypothetical protein
MFRIVLIVLFVAGLGGIAVVGANGNPNTIAGVLEDKAKWHGKTVTISAALYLSRPTLFAADTSFVQDVNYRMAMDVLFRGPGLIEEVRESVWEAVPNLVRSDFPRWEYRRLMTGLDRFYCCVRGSGEKCSRGGAKRREMLRILGLATWGFLRRKLWFRKL